MIKKIQMLLPDWAGSDIRRQFQRT